MKCPLKVEQRWRNGIIVAMEEVETGWVIDLKFKKGVLKILWREKMPERRLYYDFDIVRK